MNTNKVETRFYSFIFAASLILNWEDDSEIYNARKNKSELNGDDAEDLNENGFNRQKVSIPTHLSPLVRTKRFIFVFLFMFVDAFLTIRNVSLIYTPIYFKIGLNWGNRKCCLAGRSKTTTRILIFFNCHGCRLFI